ncbi:hypothetical protein KX729_06420 [Rhizobium sp. XQZ8]|uniref:hypothetical protein n=1 Tax=Rhizobium populisoli TaxID=2859785 RepID=UPI001CA4A5D0|nr:hypothetical protein [Rhizobium populisoli]MBW6421071.1 hypothetical protein [Rhizobium populisoli]
MGKTNILTRLFADLPPNASPIDEKQFSAAPHPFFTLLLRGVLSAITESFSKLICVNFSFVKSGYTPHERKPRP